MKTKNLSKIVSEPRSILSAGAADPASTATIEAAGRQQLQVLSHELRNALNLINGHTECLMRALSLPHQRSSLEVLQHTSIHMMRLVNNILDLGKIESGNLELDVKPFDIQSFIQKIAAAYQPVHSKKITLQLNLDQQLNFRILGDETRLRQVLDNLIGNALKFTLQGNISINLETSIAKNESLSILFSISDTGIGMDSNTIEKIVLPFRQTDNTIQNSYGGSGLGLMISQHLVKQMGGEICVESTPGKGSRFYFSLTFPIAHLPITTTDEPETMTDMEGLHILLVEDDAVNRLVARRFLEKWKIEVDEAATSIQALELLKCKSYDLLLIDLEIPDMHGTELAQQIRLQDADIPLVAFTASAYANIRQALYQKGFNDYISKPFLPEDLHKKILQLTRYGQLQYPKTA